jgi:hypothetical protein
MTKRKTERGTSILVDQFIPEVYEGDVLRVAYRDFPSDIHADILELIAGNNVQLSPRILLACLKIANGKLQILKEQLSDASGYHREIICRAEYPNYTPKSTQMDRLSEDEQRAIIQLDKSQYLEWLNRQ